jgi:hypothetical protein
LYEELGKTAADRTAWLGTALKPLGALYDLLPESIKVKVRRVPYYPLTKPTGVQILFGHYLPQ